MKKNTKCLFLRIPAFTRTLDVVGEHIKCYEKNGYVWFMKMGQKPSEAFIKMVMENNGGIIFKSQAKFGNKFYYGDLTSISPTLDNIAYPEYYNEIFKNMNMSIETTFENAIWFKIENIKELPIKKVNAFQTEKEKSLYECATHLYQVSYMYVKTKEDIDI